MSLFVKVVRVLVYVYLFTHIVTNIPRYACTHTDIQETLKISVKPNRNLKIFIPLLVEVVGQIPGISGCFRRSIVFTRNTPHTLYFCYIL